MGPSDVISGQPSTEEEYRALALRWAAKKGKPLTRSGDPLHAYIARGRWIAECPNCSSGIAVHPEWPFAACLGIGCHRFYETIEIPGEWNDIEEALLERHMKDQHWMCAEARTKWEGLGRQALPAETVADLIAQTAVIKAREQEGREVRP